MQNYHISCKAPEVDLHRLICGVKKNSFYQNQHQIDIKKPVFQKEHVQIRKYNFCVIEIRNKPEKNDNKNQVDTHHEKCSKGKTIFITCIYCIWIFFIENPIDYEMNKLIAPKEINDIKRSSLPK